METAKKILLIVLYVILAYVIIKLILQVPDAIDALTGYVRNDVATTESTALSIDNDYNVTVKYATANGDVVSSFKSSSLLLTAPGLNKPIEINYKKSEPTHIYNWKYELAFFDLFWIAFLGMVIKSVKVALVVRGSNWNKKEVDYVGTQKVIGYYSDNYYSILYSFEDAGRKKVRFVICKIGVMDNLVKNNIIQKIPIIVNPENSKEVALDYGELYKRIKIHKSYIQ